MKQPWLSVIIPVYNGENHIVSALDSIALQGDSDIECIVVDGDSTDGTLAILQAYQDKLPLKILHRERDSNWVIKTNHALTFAKGEYACFVHHDDLWLKRRLQTMRQFVEKFPEVVLFLHPSHYISSLGANLGLWSCPLPTYPKLVPRDLMMERLLIQNFISIVAPIFKRESAIKVGGMDESLWYTADWDFWLKIALCGNTLYYPIPLSGFRIHPGSQTVVRSSQAKDFRNQLAFVANKYFPLWEASAPLKQEVRKVAEFSMEVNIALASTVHGQRSNLIGLFISFLLLGPFGWYRYLRDSRIWERVSARVKTRLMLFKKSDGQ